MLAIRAQSKLSHLECPECDCRSDAHQVNTFCRECNSPLFARYDLNALRRTLKYSDVRDRPKGMWRWAELLPVNNPAYRHSLGEGDTPVIQLSHLGEALGLKNLFLKDESLNPTATFKARGLAVAVSKATELGVTHFVIPTAGNAGGALAAYASSANCSAHIFMPRDAPRVNQLEVEYYGASLHLVDGLITDAAHEARQKANQNTRAGSACLDVTTFREPYRLEGKKTIGFEIAEFFKWRLPDVIIYPTGGGTGLLGIWKAFDELQELGWIGAKRPRMICVQATGCAPLVTALNGGQERAQTWQNANTIASGLRVPTVFADRLILKTLRLSAGDAIAVSDEEIIAAQKRLSTMEGIFAAPEGAATIAALSHLNAIKALNQDDNILLINTGSGLKYI
jgi:threonine synthase